MDEKKTNGCFAAFLGAVVTAVTIAGVIAIAVWTSGCVSNKASHQHGIVVYGGIDGRVGLGYGETEDVPLGSVYLRRVYQLSPSFLWQREGTNITASVTFWDTRCATNFVFDAEGVATNRLDRAWGAEDGRGDAPAQNPEESK